MKKFVWSNSRPDETTTLIKKFVRGDSVPDETTASFKKFVRGDSVPDDTTASMKKFVQGEDILWTDQLYMPTDTNAKLHSFTGDYDDNAFEDCRHEDAFLRYVYEIFQEENQAC